MKKLIIRLAVLGGIIGFAIYYQNQQNATLNTAANRGVRLREYLLPGLRIEALRKFIVKDSKGSVTITVSDDLKSAVVAERAGYPASMDKLSTTMSDLREQKISSKVQIGKAAWAKNNLKAPGDGNEGIGTQIEMKDGADNALATLILGSNTDITGTGNPNPMNSATQRLVRTVEDGETIWQVSNTFFDLEAKPENWLDKAFIDVQKIKEISVTAAQADDSWIISRGKDSETDFALVQPRAGESLDNTKITAGSLLSSPSFNDVSPKDKAAELLKDAIKAKITTFDGFTYDIQVAKQSKEGSDKYYLSVNVAADIPQTRPAVKDEKEEDKKKADEAFAADKKSKEEKLAKEQKFAGWIYEVSEYTVNNLLKKRSEIVKLEVPKAQEGAKPTESAPSQPSASVPAPSTSSAPAPTVTPAQITPTVPPAPNPAAGANAPVSVTTTPVSVPVIPEKPAEAKKN